MFTPTAVLSGATPDSKEILVTGTDANGTPTNVLLRDHADLATMASSTPRMIPNPAWAPIEAAIFVAAAKQYDADMAAPVTEPIAPLPA